MRILVEPNAHHLLNLGDVAMLTASLERLRELWPSARVEVLTDSPSRLQELAPWAAPMPAVGRRIFMEHLSGFVNARLPAPVSRALTRFEDAFRRRHPKQYARALRARLRLLRRDGSSEVAAFADALMQTDLLVVTGAGALNDEYPALSVATLELAAVASVHDIPVAFLGQGLGPMRGTELRRRCAAVFPMVDMLSLRERRSGLPLLLQLGIDGDRPEVLVTGDDALELVVRRPIQPRGERRLGFGLRHARYSGTSEELLTVVSEAVANFATEADAQVVPVGVSLVPHEDDAALTRRLISPELLAPLLEPRLLPQEQLLRDLSSCRSVLTGSYHAAVFALGSGVPAVAIAASPYYVDKFLGLADMFQNTGIEVLVAPFTSDDVTAALRRSWITDDVTRDRLRQAAVEQASAGSAAYRRLRQLVERQACAD